MTKQTYKRAQHAERYRRYVEAMPRRLVCQDCGGRGFHAEYVAGAETYRYDECGWCVGTGRVTPWLRGRWLRLQRIYR